MRSIFNTLTRRTLSQNRTRTLVTIIGVVLSTAMIVAVTTFFTSLRQFMIDYSITRDGNWHVQADNLSARQLMDLSENKQVDAYSYFREVGYALFPTQDDRTFDTHYLYVQSMSQNALDMLPVTLSEGRLPKDDSEVMIPSWLTQEGDTENTFRIGNQISLDLGERTLDGEKLTQNIAYMDGENTEKKETFTPLFTKTYTVVGIYDRFSVYDIGAPGANMISGPKPAQNKLAADADSVCYTAFFRLKSPADAYHFAEEYLNLDGVSRSFQSGLLRWYGTFDNDNFMPVFYGLSGILIVIIMGSSILLIYNAFSISLKERTVQFGLLSSLGATKKQLRLSVLYEAFVIGMIGIPIGLVSGVGGIAVTLHFIGKNITSWIHGVSTGIPVRLSLPSILTAVLTALLTVLLSAWIPSRRIRKLSPLDAIRSAKDVRIRKEEVKTFRMTEKLFGLEGMLAEKNYKRDRRKYRATVLSLTMSIVLFVTASLYSIYLTRAGSFVLDAPESELLIMAGPNLSPEQEETLEQLLAAEEEVHSIRKYRTAGAQLVIPAKSLSDEVRQNYNPGISADQKEIYWHAAFAVISDEAFSDYMTEAGIDPESYLNSDTLVLPYQSIVRSYNPETQRYEKENPLTFAEGETLRFGETAWQENAGEADGTMLFTTNFTASAGKSIHTIPDIPIGSQVSGSLIFLIPETTYIREMSGGKLPLQFNTCYDLNCPDYPAAYESLEQKLTSERLKEMGFENGNVYLSSLAENYESDRSLLTAVRVLAYGFITLITLIAVANVFHTVSTNLMLRRKEFAMLRSMGMSQKGLIRMMNYESLIYGIRSILYGSVLSLLISALLCRFLSQGVDTAMIFPVKELLTAFVFVVLVVFSTMLYTMHKLRHNNIIEELKMD